MTSSQEETLCKISLKPVLEKDKYNGYTDSAVKKLFGSVKVTPQLTVSRSDFFQNSGLFSKGMSISGVQQKLSLAVNLKGMLEPTTENGRYILKPSPEQFPFAAENEHTAMLCGQWLGIETADCGLVPFHGSSELAYITRRFDRTLDGSKIHQEDLLQCFELPSTSKYDKTYEEAGLLLNKVCNGRKAVVLDFIKRVIFAYLIGNDDLHLKNLSVQRLSGNRTRYYDCLTPNYDCLFCSSFSNTIQGSGDLALGLLRDASDGGEEEFSKAFGEFGYYTGTDFLELAKRLDVPGKAIHRFIRLLQDKRSALQDLVQSSFMPEDMKERAKQVIADRTKALLHTE